MYDPSRNKWKYGLIGGLTSGISRLIEGAGISSQGPPWLIGKLCWLRCRRRCRALHGEEAWLGTRRCEGRSWAEGDWGWLRPWGLVEGRVSWRRIFAIWLCFAEVVCRLHIEPIARRSCSWPWDWTTRRNWWRGCWSCIRRSLLVLCQSTCFGAVNVAICLLVTS